jgi:hypothetical protein
MVFTGLVMNNGSIYDARTNGIDDDELFSRFP